MKIPESHRPCVEVFAAALAGNGDELMDLIMGLSRRDHARLMNVMYAVHEMDQRTAARREGRVVPRG